MLARADIGIGIYLRLQTPRLGYPAGLTGTVHTIGTDWSGNWYFQLRWLNRDKDLEDFERIESWEQVQEMLRESQPPSKPRKKGLRLPRHLSPLGRVPKGAREPDQLKLYDQD